MSHPLPLCKQFHNKFYELVFTIGINPTADGSAYLEYNNVKVICSVCGPVDVH